MAMGDLVSMLRLAKQLAQRLIDFDFLLAQINVGQGRLSISTGAFGTILGRDPSAIASG